MSMTAISDSWRQALIEQIDARPRDVVADVGCGTGELAVMLKVESPGTAVFGLDPKPAALDLAERRAVHAGATVHFIHATLNDIGGKLAARSPTQIVCSNVLGFLSLRSRRALLRAMFAAMPRGGVIHIADSGLHRLSRFFLGFPMSLPKNSRDGVLTLMRQAGLSDCAETMALPAGAGTMLLFRGVKP